MRNKCKIINKGKLPKDMLLLNQNQFEFVYKDEILNEVMLEFLESKGLLEDEDEQSNISERR